jgi:alkylated DNA repair dioxygenase AlkB
MQPDLFGSEAVLPHGLVYCPDFLARDEETILLEEIRRLPFRQARFQQYTARRRVVRFGSDAYPSLVPDEESDFPRVEFPPFLCALRSRVAAWTAIPEARFEHGLVTEYSPGTPIGWHRDAPHHETVVGFSLAGECRMRFRPLRSSDSRTAINLPLEPRSVYVMRDEIRWHWQHSIPPVKALRYSITMRTRCPGAR